MGRPDNFSRFNELRRRYPLFCYQAFHHHYTGAALEIDFEFVLTNKLRFAPNISIPWKESLFRPYDDLSSAALDQIIFHIGLIEMISYWKAACSPEVLIRPFGLVPQQVGFWKKLYWLGLGEFFYKNGIETGMSDFMKIRTVGQAIPALFNMGPSRGSLVPVGGGKDSAVTLGLLNRWGMEWLPMVINPRGATKQVIRAAGKSDDETIEIFRGIDPLLLQLNARGFLNGHTPFSALLAFYSLLIAYLTGRTDILLSNESSANEPTIPGTEINHQYSKSFGFEKDFRDYCRSFISPGFNYFSLLRPLSELQIARIFSGMPGFFGAFKSCNAGSKSDSWCGKCPKCLFTFIMLSPFLEPTELESIFGKNLFDDIHLQGIMDELTGVTAHKPFECIGTTGEVNRAMVSSLKKYDPDHLPALLQYYAQQGDMSRYPGKTGEIASPGPDLMHFVPAPYYERLIREIK